MKVLRKRRAARRHIAFRVRAQGLHFRRQGGQLHREPRTFLTALSDHDNELKGWQLGADDYLTKPVDYDVLAALITARAWPAVQSGPSKSACANVKSRHSLGPPAARHSGRSGKFSD